MRSTRDQLGNCNPILATVPLYRILQLVIFECCPALASTRSVDVGIQDNAPSVTALFMCYTRNQRGNCIPTLVTVSLYCILQRTVFFCCPATRTSISTDIGSQDTLTPPSVPPLFFRSIRDQRGNCTPILATLRLYCIFQLAVFVFYTFTRTSIRSADVGIKDIMPSVTTLTSHLTRNQRGNCIPICLVLLTVLLLAGIRNCTTQLCIFF
jgi:hypothetical protein